MLDIASASSASNQVQIERGSSQENAASAKQLLTKDTGSPSVVRKGSVDSSVERKEVESSTGPSVGKKVDIRA